MNMKDKNVRITLRLNEDQFNFVKQSADELGISPSEFLRMVVNVTMVATKSGGVQGRENDKANINNIIQ